MAEFLNPFSPMAPDRKLNKRELTRCIRQALVSEEEAIHLYEALADAADDPVAKAVFQDIANEEKVHAGEFQRLLNRMLPDEETFLADGAGEVDALAEAVLKKCTGSSETQGKEKNTIPVPGCLNDVKCAEKC